MWQPTARTGPDERAPERELRPGATRRGLLAAGVAGLAGLAVAACSPGGTGSGGNASGPGAGSGGSATGAGTAPTAGPAASGTGAAGTASSAGPAARPVAGPDIAHGPRDRQAVALTFHGAGDPAIVRDMLATVGRAGARLTVLAIGQWLAGDPALAGMIRDGGHDLGNHTWSHRTMPGLSAAQTRDEVDRAAQELTRLTGSAGRWFRPSGTPASTAAIRAAAVAAGYGACLAYDVDPMDYADPGPDAVVARFTAAVRPGSIVSLHLGHPGTLQAIPRLLTVLRSRGLAAVTVTDLLRAA